MTTQIVVIQSEQGHTQNTDTYLDYGGVNQAAASAIKAVIDAKDTDGTLAANSDSKYATQKAVKTYALPLSYLDIGTVTTNSDTKVPSQKAVKTYVDLVDSLVNIQLALKIPLTYLDTDGTLAANSDVKIPSQKAAKTYIDLRIPLTYLDTDGTLTANSDTKIATQKAVKTYVDLRIPLTYLDTDGTLAANSDTKVATQKAVKTYADNIAERSVVLVAIDYTTNCSTGNNKAYFRVPDILAGMNLHSVAACCITAGTTGTMTIQIRNVTRVVDMLTTEMTIDSAELDTLTAATPAVIDTTNDDVSEGDVLAVDIDTVHTVVAKGLLVSLTFKPA
ncbi:MAG: hypothetical protein WC208_14935 [Gallionella sp.]|jgi:hypothetical protein